MQQRHTPVGRKIAKAGSKLKYTMYTPQPENNYHMYRIHQHQICNAYQSVIASVYHKCRNLRRELIFVGKHPHEN